MNIAQHAIEKKIITLLFTAIFLIGGILAYTQLGRFEDPQFTIKSAIITTAYPGASPYEVENEVTELIEKAVQELPELDTVSSISSEGRSLVTIEIKPQYTGQQLPAIWQKLRNQIADISNQLPPGASTPQINDDFGDVYGILFAVTGDGYSYAELKEHVDFLRRELLLVPGVAKVILWGIQQQAIYIDIFQNRLAQLKLSEKNIYSTINIQNMVIPAGDVSVGSQYVEISPTGTASSIEQLSNIVISGAHDSIIRLSDLANIHRGYTTPPQTLMRYNGKPAIGLGISTITGGNVVKTGKLVKEKLDALENLTPAGIEISTISYQSDTVTHAINGFFKALIEAFIIVVLTLVVTMGIRSGLLQGMVMLITIGATLIGMYLMHIDFQRISLGALIISLGMLVDDAIVVNEGMLVNLEKGLDKLKSAIEIVQNNIWPLFAATTINALAFAAISFSPDNTGEYCNSLFWVIALALMMSWLIAITITPLLGVMFLKTNVQPHTPYQHKIYHYYQNILMFALKRKGKTMFSMLFLLILAILGFGLIKHSFFPDSDRPQFLIDYWLPQGTHIEQVSSDLKEIEQYLLQNKNVTNVATFVGAGAPRFILTYMPEHPNRSYGQLIVGVKDYRKIDHLLISTKQHIQSHFPSSEPIMQKFKLGTGGIGTVKVRIRGDESSQLRALSEQVRHIFLDNSNAINIKTNWRNQVPVIRPQFFEVGARLTGISKSDLSQALEETFDGRQIGVFRESNELIPIVAKRIFSEKISFDNLYDVTIWSPTAQQAIPIMQVLNGIELIWQNPFLCRRNQIKTIEIQCDPMKGLASELFNQVKGKIQAIELPSGYHLEWGGEYENSKKAQAGLWRGLPLSYLAMALIVIILFNRLKQPLIIFLCVPLAIIGVTFGLLITGTPFGFMALLGLLSLSGMLIKNAIVLITQIDQQRQRGKYAYRALIDASVSRLRPVTMTALTASLGLLPLLPDIFFRGMAVTIIFGLMFATILTLIIVPVLYAWLFKIEENIEDII